MKLFLFYIIFYLFRISIEDTRIKESLSNGHFSRCYLKQTYFDSTRAIKRTGFNLALFVLRAVDLLGNPALCWSEIEKTGFDLEVTEISGFSSVGPVEPIRHLDCFSILKFRFVCIIKKKKLRWSLIHILKDEHQWNKFLCLHTAFIYV